MIETARLLIRPLTAAELKNYVDSPHDFAELNGLSASEYLMDSETREAILVSLLPYITDTTKDSDFYTMYILIEKAKKTIIGGICFHGEPNDKGEAEVGYGIDSAFHNRGYMTEALAAFVQWTRDNKSVRTLTAETDKTNSASVKVLEKTGFVMIQEGEKLIRFQLLQQ